jgi:iron complex transport system ATP-binding protein
VTQQDRPALLAHDLCIQRGARLIVDRLELSIRPGECWGLVGPNGAGKSTFLEAVVGALPYSSGTLELGGRDAKRMPPRVRARFLALTGREQQSTLSLTARTLVELGALAGAEARSETVAQADVTDALRHADCLTLADRPLTALSDGQRARAQIARAFAQKPQLLLLDEATAHLDQAHREATLSLLGNFARNGRAAIAVLHDLDLAVRYCTHLLVLSGGRGVAQGKPKEVLTETLLGRVFGVRAALISDELGSSVRIFGPAKPPALEVSSWPKSHPR